MDPDAMLSADDVERMARAAHGEHRRRTPGEPAWQELPEASRAANRASVAFAPTMLTALGLRLDRTTAPAGVTTHLTDEEVDAGARMEHLRWSRHTTGTRPDHPDLRPWSELDEVTRDKDRVRVRGAVGLLALVGVAVRRAGTLPDRHRLLSVDGGGVRGVIALGVLARLEALLRVEEDDPDLVLGEWFDYVAGTSTGAVIAAGLALGMSVSHLQGLYRENASTIFRPSGLLDRWSHRYDDDGLADLLRRELGEATTLGSERLRCLLMVALRDATTGSPWPVSSNPAALYNSGTGSNLELPLWQLVRSSAAAPTYFPPERITLGDGEEHLFTDGGVTTLNNPALQLYLMATHPAYRLGWPVGPERLLLVSVGTGTTPRRPGSLEHPGVLQNARLVPEALVHAATVQQDLLCRVLGGCRHGPAIDGEVGDLVGGTRATPAAFSYVRYDAETTPESLARLGVGHLRAEHLRELDDVDHLEELAQFGAALATDVRAEHLSGFLRGPGAGSPEPGPGRAPRH